MLYDLKIILKKSKPVLWYELEVPGGITFSVLSVFLDIVSGTKDAPPSGFMFELPSFEVQLREGIFEDGSHPLYRQDLREADTTFIDEYMEKNAWFTYKPDKNEDTAFRVEVKEISSKKEGNPFHGRYSRGVFELYEKEGESAFKEKVRQFLRFRMQYDEDFRFIKKKELLDALRKKPSLSEGQVPTWLDPSVYVPTMTEPESRPENTIRSIAKAAKEGAEQLKEALGIKNFRSADGESLREVLYSIYREEDLRDLAEEIGINTDLPGELLAMFRKKERELLASMMLAKRCADRLLEKECMEERLLSMNDRQTETFRKAIKGGGVFKAVSFEDGDDMAFLYERDYAAETKNADEFLIPTDVMEVFKEIDTPEFHHRRQQHVWLLDCLEVVEYYYGSIPIEQFYRLYRQFGELSLEEMTEAIQALDDFDTLCVVHDGRIIFSGWLHDDEYKALENSQRDKAYYIPTKEEVEDISRNGYPSQQREAKKLLAFFKNEMEMEEIDAEDLTEEVWYRLNQGGDFHDVMDLINEKNLVFPSEKAMQKFVQCVTDLNNTTPLLYNRGFRPKDLMPLEIEQIRRKGMTVVPGSTQVAGMLQENADKLRAMGINIDLDSNAREIDTAFVSPDRKTVIAGKKKIYPNDPCPCGSGKKYKKCCGRG